MSLNLLAVQDQITEKLRELPQDVYETTPSDDSKLRFDSAGTILPYIVVIYSDMYESIDSAGIVSTRLDTKVSYADVYCCAPTERAARQVAELVRDKLLGFSPVDAGEIRIEGGAKYPLVNAKTGMFISELNFSLPVNTVW